MELTAIRSSPAMRPGYTDISYTIGYAADDTYASFLDSLTASSLYDTGVSVGTDDSIITLSTCTNKGEKRFVVHAKKVY